MQTKLGRKVRDWFGSEDTRVILSPRILAFEILLQATKRVVDSTVQNHFTCADCQPFRREFPQQCDGVMIQLSPTDGIDIAKEAVYLWLPTPPQVSSQSHAFVVKRVRINFIRNS